MTAGPSETPAPYSGPMADDPVSAALGGRCPRCGEGRLFAGFLKLAPGCRACGLDYAFADSGDGPAVFVILIAGFLIIGLALYVEIAYEPPFWLHLALFLPLTILVCLALLRPLKALMIGLQFRNKAEEGRLSR
ncbi:MAG: DUF983 domain-containing protein, partial [Hyphomicrobiales bacterium]|uniref:DUF983 domain-containing protein n=1 Tax=Rhabdaerophilum calidifontis TaxID=2604328 RepID=UPI00123BBF49|nr:DUF983 domain-containing protein [Rhabdaerophilum calidifontis]MCA1999382.1 DUF983 domain-containing protein [Hyphomicrobiales bacterium]